jgi:putative transposase
MPRTARLVLPGVAHLVSHRGLNHQDVFFSEDDRRLYLQLLNEECQRWGFGLLGYCLMSNHVHLVGIPLKSESLARAVGRTHWRYTQIINSQRARPGHLWQNRFHSAPMDDDHVLMGVRYV